MKVAIIKYNAGNIRSVSFALDRLGVNYVTTDQPEEIMTADKVLFPGVGEASTTMDFLKARKLDQVILKLTQPVLGICLGMQLLCTHSEENNTSCLGVFDLEVKKFTSAAHLKVPHTGWNALTNVSGWLGNQLENQFVYFVHSFYVPVSDYTVAQTLYGTPFSAALKKNNFYAVQFHPEKSSEPGEMVLEKFLVL
ncbi:MAG: imidazole glycerol phosphate synthase subunit HisH [Cyclobacteriaceae bacterium]